MSTYTAKDTQAFYDKMGHFYYRLWGSYLHWGYFTDHNDLEHAAQDATKHFISRLPIRAGELVCDLACGSGGPMSYLQAETGCNCVGMDISATQLRLAQRYTACSKALPNLSLVQADAHILPFLSASFDALCCFSSFYYFHDKAQILAEISRVVKPEGYFFLDDMIKNEDLSLSTAEMCEILERQRLSRLETAEGYRRLLFQYGFRILCEEDLTSHFVRSYTIVRDRLQSERTRYLDLSEAMYSELVRGFDRLVLAGSKEQIQWRAFWCERQ